MVLTVGFTEKLTNVIDKEIASKQNIEVKGEIVFDSKGLSKEEVVKLEPFITGIKVISEIVHKSFLEDPVGTLMKYLFWALAVL